MSAAIEPQLQQVAVFRLRYSQLEAEIIDVLARKTPSSTLAALGDDLDDFAAQVSQVSVM
jgi:hypothetical protein